MSKIKIEASLKNSNENHTYKGKGIKNKQIIIYNDEKVQTKVTLDNIITIERIGEYYLKLNLKKGIKLKGIYKTNYGSLNIETITEEIKKEKNSIKIIYKLIINNAQIDTFTYNLKFTLDT